MAEERALVRNASDESQIREAGRKSRHRRSKEIVDVKRLLDDESGRRVLWRYLTYCGIYGVTFTTDAAMAAFNEGRRSVGLMILADIMDTDPSAYVKMMEANRKEEETDGGRGSERRDGDGTASGGDEARDA